MHKRATYCVHQEPYELRCKRRWYHGADSGGIPPHELVTDGSPVTYVASLPRPPHGDRAGGPGTADVLRLLDGLLHDAAPNIGGELDAPDY
jgi:hypothetical protein